MKSKPLIHVKVKGIKGAKAKKLNTILTKEFNSTDCIRDLIIAQSNFLLWGTTSPKTP